MSDLQLALIALGAVIIAGVILFNWWQERRLMQDSVKRFEDPVDDALMQDFRIDPNNNIAVERTAIVVEEIFDAPDRLDESEPQEPWLADDDNKVLPVEPEQPVQEPLQSEASLNETEPATTPEEPAPEPDQATFVDRETVGPDERIDLIALMQAEAGFSAPAVLQAVQGLPKLDKPVYCYGLTDTDEWQPIVSGQENIEFKRVACALQLADRSGPATHATIDSFEVEMENLAAALLASLEWQGAADPAIYAAELDQFCVAVDVMVGFHIMHGSNGPIAGTKLRGLAEAQGLRLDADGAFHFEDNAGNTLFTIVSQDLRPFRPETLRTVFYRGISFQLDVPRVNRCTNAFNQMVLLARQLEITLDGTLVDDNQRALGDSEISKISQQLDLIHSSMVERGILPGSPAALRLFS